MYLKEFSSNDILINRIKTHPRYEFNITNTGEFFLKNKAKESEALGGNEIAINNLNLEVQPNTGVIEVEYMFDFSQDYNSFNIGLI
jgi:hypothetical protein